MSHKLYPFINDSCLVNNRVVKSKDLETEYTSRAISAADIQTLGEYFRTTTVKDLLSRLEVLLQSISNKFNSSSTLVEMNDNRDVTLLSWFLKSMAAKYLCNEKHRGYALDTVC